MIDGIQYRVRVGILCDSYSKFLGLVFCVKDEVQCMGRVGICVMDEVQ